MNEIIVKGGLGNQLFIILEAYKILSISGQSVALNLTEYDIGKRPDRPFVVGDFLPQILTDFRISIGQLAHLRYICAKLCERFENRTITSLRLPGDATCSFLTLSGRRVYIGYYQHVGSTPVDESALARMRAMFAPSVSNAYPNRLAIHVRRGDYLLGQHSMHGLVAIRDLLLETERALQEEDFEGITVFTDSPELLDIAEFGAFGVDVTIDQGGGSTEVLTRLASHAGIIASNSSFSLWAGLLGRPRYFSLPQFWMPGIESTRLGLNWVRRYPCTL